MALVRSSFVSARIRVDSVIATLIWVANSRSRFSSLLFMLPFYRARKSPPRGLVS